MVAAIYRGALLIVGVAALIAPIMGWERTAVREALVATLVSLAAFVIVQGEIITRIEGIAMLMVLAGYLFSTYWLERRTRAAKTFQHEAEAFEIFPCSALGWRLSSRLAESRRLCSKRTCWSMGP